jgi:arylsulfatase A-like enzyme
VKSHPNILPTVKSPPNILLIMSDQQRWDSLGCTGAPWVSTPHLGTLAAQGVLFSNCYANNPICTPARASLMTGLELPGHGVYQLHDILDPRVVLFPQRLRERGYHTALYGKLHVSGRIEEAVRRHPNDGFDVYEWCLEPAVDIDAPFNGYTRWLEAHHPDFLQRLRSQRRHRGHDSVDVSMNRWAADRTIAYLQEHARRGGTQPFFCKMSVFDPHNPYDNYPVEMAQHVDASRMPAPVQDPEDAATGSALPWAFTAEREHSYLGPLHELKPEDFQAMRLGYHAMVAHIDREVGRVLEALEDSGLADDTMVIYTSDHGDMLGDHGGLVKGAMLFDPCIRVPLIVRGPQGFHGGTTRQGLVQLHDLPATILRMAGAQPDELQAWMPSARDIAPLARGDADEVHPYIVCPYRNSGINDEGLHWDPAIHATMVRSGHHKLHIYHPVADHQPKAIYRLYDLHADPQELHDLSQTATGQQIMVRLKDQFTDWLLQVELGQGGRGGQASPAPDQRIVNRLN